MEPNVTFRFGIGPTGIVSGEYSFRDDLVHGDILQGEFTIE